MKRKKKRVSKRETRERCTPNPRKRVVHFSVDEKLAGMENVEN
jgi:hypothetical protein